MIVYRIVFDFYLPNAYRDVRVAEDDGSVLAEIIRLHTPTYTKKKTSLQRDANGNECAEALVIRKFAETFVDSPYGGTNAVLKGGEEVWVNPFLYEEAEFEINGEIVKSHKLIR